ncbi:hypothetical protein HRJ35_20730 [Shewanella oneidensis MR-1]|uniref:Uncharacterized protein n=1 Tax=Shewanella oneidensis (strain ATCC 700550 / JCM 31522 / CIP 106686 / LMG 19005 / NCIMB 14063 / MR-1) TaxID=211586 RepID=Q8EAL6_SHEON|nr:hypothetical protein [Shewanella oneidensis]AAN56861.1 uncharacterized protein SO_3886 [Shewanella oneidensis MR-1]MDX5998776.1 hypothetical protein [Shewanella oneidensis]MEE2027953.1 hypothetical protein [Shewanella oneidensis]QKG98185.1 hypothetical protein HRJ35_20730 [Shewanella oneidensis MR-1]
MTTVLSSLKVIARPEIAPKPPVLGKRMKLLDKLDQQLSLAECMIEGREFEAYKERSVKDPETGERKKIRRRYIVRPWFYDSNEHYYFEVRISNKPIELEKGCPAIDVGEKANLPAVIKVVINAVEKGELDEQLLAPVPKIGKKASTDKASSKASK